MANKVLDGRVILVTGASRGIGYQAALALAKAGSHIIATARTQGGLEDLDDAIKADGGDCTLVPMDLKNTDGIDQLGKIIHERWGRLDGFFANAGVLGEITPAPHTDQKKWDEVMAVNVTSNYRFIRSLDPLLRASDAGRALFVSSSVARTHAAYWGAYAASKATRTAMRAKAMPGEDPVLLPNPADLAPLIVEMLSPDYAQNDTLVTFRQTDYYKA